MQRRGASRFVRDARLSGKVWLGETFVPVNASRLILRGGRKLRGIFRNQVAICAAVDDSGNRFAEAAGKGHPRGAKCLRVYSSRIERGSRIVRHGFMGHGRFAEWNAGP